MESPTRPSPNLPSPLCKNQHIAGVVSCILSRRVWKDAVTHHERQLPPIDLFACYHDKWNRHTPLSACPLNEVNRVQLEMHGNTVSPRWLLIWQVRFDRVWNG